VKSPSFSKRGLQPGPKALKITFRSKILEFQEIFHLHRPATWFIRCTEHTLPRHHISYPSICVPSRLSPCRSQWFWSFVTKRKRSSRRASDNIPEPMTLNSSDSRLPHVFVPDDRAMKHHWPRKCCIWDMREDRTLWRVMWYRDRGLKRRCAAWQGGPNLGVKPKP
jgi:hypothetical protein